MKERNCCCWKTRILEFTSSYFATTERRKGYPVSFGGMVQNSFHPTVVVFTTVTEIRIEFSDVFLPSLSQVSGLEQQLE